MGRLLRSWCSLIMGIRPDGAKTQFVASARISSDTYYQICIFTGKGKSIGFHESNVYCFFDSEEIHDSSRVSLYPRLGPQRHANTTNTDHMQ